MAGDRNIAIKILIAVIKRDVRNKEVRIPIKARDLQTHSYTSYSRREKVTKTSGWKAESDGLPPTRIRPTANTVGQ